MELLVASNAQTVGRNQTPLGSLTLVIRRLEDLHVWLWSITCSRERGLMPRSIVELQISRGWW